MSDKLSAQIRVRLTQSLPGFNGKRVLVIGDMVADEYVIGRPARISREAPVLILHHSEEFIRPGGAANVAYNLVRLGATVHVAGLVGSDRAGGVLSELLDQAGVDISALVIDPERCTPTKTRVIGRGDQEVRQQIVRIDRVDVTPMPDAIGMNLIASFHSLVGDVDAVVISDYENGVVNPAVLADILPEARQRGVVIGVDSHGDLFRFQGVTFATPNQPEAEATLHRSLESVQELETAGEELRAGMHAGGVLLTRGSQGMTLFEQGREPAHLSPSNLREVFDPSGAGDTACAVFTLALLSGAAMIDAARLSNIAAGEVVKKLGAATISVAELLTAVSDLEP